MIKGPDVKDRIGKARAMVSFYRDSLATMLNRTEDKRLIVSIRLTLHDVIKLESDPLLYANHGRRRPGLVSSWLDKIEQSLRGIDTDYKVLIQHFEHRGDGTG